MENHMGSCLFNQLFAWWELNEAEWGWMRRPAATVTAWKLDSLQYEVISSYRLSPWFLLQTATATATSIVGKGNKHHCSQSLHIIPTYTIPSSKVIHLENPQSSKENNPQMVGFHGFSISPLIYRRVQLYEICLNMSFASGYGWCAFFWHHPQGMKLLEHLLAQSRGHQPHWTKASVVNPEILGCTFSDKPIP